MSGERSPAVGELSTLQTIPAVDFEQNHRVPVLTIAAHPDRTRVGHFVMLADLEGGDVSRSGPNFVAPRGPGSAPLDDPHLSRKPIAVCVTSSGGVRIERGDNPKRVFVNGVSLDEARELQPEALSDGIVIAFSKRVVLVLHWRRVLVGSLVDEGEMLGESDGIHAVRQQVGQVATLDSAVLVRGESGSGKELVARAVHAASPRSAGPFVAVNMATLSSAVGASELFGHVRGAFTGAESTRAGYFGAARGGTLFLDEIADTAPDVQAMLLRVLENGEYQAVGGTTTERADVRVIAATDAKLDAAVKEGRFRLPPFHRLATHQIMVPPLRERREDVGVLLMHFLSRELQTIGQGDLLDPRSPKEASWLPAELVERMLLSMWPGNVRQLYNVARHLVASNRERSSVHPDSVPEHILGGVAEGSSSAASAGSSSKPAPADIGDEGLIRALRANDWKMAATAKSLGIARSSLYRLIDGSAAIRKAKDVSREEIEAAHARHGGAAEAMAVALEVSPRGLKLRMKDLGISD